MDARPSISLQEKMVENPLSGGGGRDANLTKDLDYAYAVRCSNASHERG